MGQSQVLIIDEVLSRRGAVASAVKRLGFTATISDGGQAIDLIPDLAIVDASLLVSRPALLNDLHRTSTELRILLIIDADSLESVTAALSTPHLGFLPALPTDADLALAVALLDDPREAGAADGDSGYALRLAALGEEIARIARAIEPSMAPAGSPPVPDSPLAFDPANVRAVLKARRQRDALFAEGIFADPVWDMLLDLTAARGEGKRVSVSSLAIAAAVPPTTALRHLKAMVDAGLVVRRADPEDGRRIHIDLSDDAFARMRAWVAGLGKAV